MLIGPDDVRGGCSIWSNTSGCRGSQERLLRRGMVPPLRKLLLLLLQWLGVMRRVVRPTG